MGALKTFVNKLFKESFNTTFMGNIKKKTIKKFKLLFSFLINKFLKIFHKPLSIENSLAFPLLFSVFFKEAQQMLNCTKNSKFLLVDYFPPITYFYFKRLFVA